MTGVWHVAHFALANNASPRTTWASVKLRRGGVPSREKIRDHLSGNYCRCTGYQAIVDAVESVARARADNT
jgi:aerobic-type carbon monoxide dehydrogenase small subunit (CoxS/CutS family)